MFHIMETIDLVAMNIAKPATAVWLHAELNMHSFWPCSKNDMDIDMK